MNISNRLRQVKRFSRRVIDRATGVAERHANPYATHLPVLLGLAANYKINSILELGCGLYSTKKFLEVNLFPHLTKLHSLENDAAWFSQMAALQTDARLTMSLVQGDMSDAIATLDLAGYDLIFIDDSLTADERARSIQGVAVRVTAATVVAVHDFEVPEYQQAAQDFPHRFAFDAFNPHTGLAWSNGQLDSKALQMLNRVLKKHARYIEPDDTQSWHKIISDNLRRT